MWLVRQRRFGARPASAGSVLARAAVLFVNASALKNSDSAGNLLGG